MGNVQVGEREIGLTNPPVLLRLEGEVGQSWIWFVVLFFAPDLSMAGYAAGNRVGAAAYNAAHTLVLPLILGAFGVLGERDLATGIALIWLAHIAMDRALGYGLKLPTGFKDTH